jgi:hypothetical protein
MALQPTLAQRTATITKLGNIPEGRFMFTNARPFSGFSKPPGSRYVVRKFTGLDPQTCRPQLCIRANLNPVIKVRFAPRAA